MLRKLIWLILAACLVYSGYWMIGAKGTEHAISSWFSERSSEGWQAEHQGIETKGFPMRFDTEILAPRLADPKSGVAFSTESFDILSKSHQPTRFTAQLSGNSTLASPFQRLEITQERAEAQLFVEPDTDLTLDHTAVQIENLTLNSTASWGLTLDNAALTSQRRAEDPLTHDIRFSSTGFAPTGGLIAELNPQGVLSDQLELLELTMSARFDTPWNIHALEGPRPQPTRIEISDFAINWGKLSLKLAGAFDVDARGYPVGKLAIKAVNWREILELAIATGAIPDEMSGLVLRGGEMLAGLSGRKDTIDATLTLKDGMISLGFIPLGPAPRLIIR